jgi:hypothetical protein
MEMDTTGINDDLVRVKDPILVKKTHLLKHHTSLRYVTSIIETYRTAPVF